LNNQTVFSLAISGNNIFAGASGVWLSTNNGQNWTQKNQGWGPVIPNVEALLIANNYIFAGTHNHSVWRRTITDIITNSKTISTEIPSAYSLEQNYPNPFNPVTKIKFSVPLSSHGTLQSGIQVVLKVFNILGKEVLTLVNEKLQPGIYETTFDASILTSGIYFYRLQTSNFIETKRMTLIK